jgi:hypothetical protein
VPLAGVDLNGLTAGFLSGGFFCRNALGAGLFLRMGCALPVFGVVELGPDGGVGAAEALMLSCVYKVECA